MTVKIILRRDKEIYLPIGQTKFLTAGSEVYISYIQWPGKAFTEGSVGASLHPDGANEWSFWTSNDIDVAMIFVSNDVSKIIVSGDEPRELLDQLRDSYFQVDFA